MRVGLLLRAGVWSGRAPTGCGRAKRGGRTRRGHPGRQWPRGGRAYPHRPRSHGRRPPDQTGGWGPPTAVPPRRLWLCGERGGSRAGGRRDRGREFLRHPPGGGGGSVHHPVRPLRRGGQRRWRSRRAARRVKGAPRRGAASCARGGPTTTTATSSHLAAGGLVVALPRVALLARQPALVAVVVGAAASLPRPRPPPTVAPPPPPKISVVMGDRVVLPPQPLAHIVTAVSTAATYGAVRQLLGCPPWVAAAAAAVAAPLVALCWPRFATDTLRLHGTVLPGVPGDGDGWLLGRAPELARAMAAKRTCFLVTAWRAAAGTPNYQVWLAGKRRVYLSHPTDIAHVLGRVCPPRDRRWMRAFGLPISPKVLILTAGAEHAAARRLLAAPLADGRVLAAAAAGVVADVWAEGGGGGGAADAPVGGPLAAAADGGGAADVAAAAEAITLRAMHRTMVSVPATAGADFGPALRALFPLLLPLMLVPAPGVFAPRRLARIRAVGDRFRRYMVHHEAARRAAYDAGRWPRSQPRDILDVLLADADGGGVYAGDRDRLAADFMALLVAGVDTTAQSLQWGIYLLCTHPDVQARVLQEVSTVLPPSAAAAAAAAAAGATAGPTGSSGEQGTPSSPPPPPAFDAATFTALPYLHTVWQETLRLYPPAASGVSRRLAADVVLPSCGAVLPAGTSIKMPHHTTFRSPQNYPHPDTFDPDRWATPPAAAGPRGGGGGGGGNTGSAKGVGENAWRPFGMGPGSCMGRDLAEVEWKAAVATLVTKYEVSLAGPASGVKEVDAITLRPSQMLVRLRRRVPAGGGG
ncbi:hypothetical protein I4F81_012213 [Pyropia yezoensis]|uniref:Uncharacterized protein n=1 Tax=Pyropia yezoensis TaxID=2788 RepID=A0ACC3CHU2_PYRYE|nr:hypothetical protein I4F81_012213 [Neopyropia yezoensis]